MRNLKRVLSLALALVMVLGMMVITTSAADFTDADEITQTEAVEVLAALGIVQGSNGAFDPNGTFTREAAAKLLTYMKLGPTMAEKLAGTEAFTDVAATRWSAKYIGYCANLGYIAGNGDGTFNPSGVLTDIALGKLVLCAIGKDPAKYTGANWATAVTVDMIDTGLVDSVTGTAISREDACAMILTAMKYSETPKTYDVMDGTDKLGTFTDLLEASLYAKLLGADVVTSEPTDTLLAEVYDVTYKSDDTDKFGRPAVSYKDGKKVNLVYAEDATVTYAGADWKDVSKLMEDYDFSKAETIYNGSTYAEKYDAFYGKNGVTVEVYADKDDVVSKVIVTEGYVTEVKDVKTDEKTEITTVTLTVKEAGYYLNHSKAYKTIAITSEDKANYPLVKDFAKGDVFMGFYAQDWDKDCKLLKVDAVESVEGKVTSKSATPEYEGWVKIDGEKYEFANEYSQAAANVKSEGTFYLYNGYIVDFAGTVEEEAEDVYAYVLAMDSETVKGGLFDSSEVTTWYAQLLYTDGTVEVVATTEKDGDMAGKIVTCTAGKDDDEGKTVLATDEAFLYGSNVTVTKNNANFGSGIANSKTIFVVGTKDKDDKDVFTAYTGVTNVPVLKAGTTAAIKDEGVWTVYYLLKAELVTGDETVTANDVVYLAKAGSMVEEVVGEKVLAYYTYTAIVNGEVTTVNVGVDEDGAALVGVGLYSALTYDEDGLVVDKTVMADNEKAGIEMIDAATGIGEAKNGVIALGEKSYIYDDATVVYEVAANGAISEVAIADIEANAEADIVGYTTDGILTMVIVK